MSHSQGNVQPATDTLQRTLLVMLNLGEGKVHIVLDAMDECSERRDLIRFVKDVVTDDKLNTIQLVATGRPEQDFLGKFPRIVAEGSCIALGIASISSDIRSYGTEIVESADFERGSEQEDARKKTCHGVEQSKWNITRLCPSLVSIVDSTDGQLQDSSDTLVAYELHIAHPSVKEYILGKEGFGIRQTSVPMTLRYPTHLDIMEDADLASTCRSPFATLAAATCPSNSGSSEQLKESAAETLTFLREMTTCRLWTEANGRLR
ncbi:exodeoxyribonuclease V alpha subunit [Geosmithia morbida]|uniref:Exodeoxyribonuclease V alpha subunit n=1 Tax=Geosmithia morbida TaxID=1094350 RepID=A0A9P4YR80_9HYPO|nr:exodeoxyribonuclease V alpha subunit [Geosmithia morbida]KAF4121092.1 exodeoxyribonuclease V alpha subunit [Geosmithia morbida]